MKQIYILILVLFVLFLSSCGFSKDVADEKDSDVTLKQITDSDMIIELDAEADPNIETDAEESNIIPVENDTSDNHITINIEDIPFTPYNGESLYNLSEEDYETYFTGDRQYIQITLDNFITESYIDSELAKLTEITKFSRNNIIRDFTEQVNLDFVSDNSLEDYVISVSIYEPFINIHVTELTYSEIIDILSDLCDEELVYSLTVNESMLIDPIPFE